MGWFTDLLASGEKTAPMVASDAGNNGKIKVTNTETGESEVVSPDDVRNAKDRRK